MLASPAKASGDSGCYAEWDLYSRNLSCANSGVIAPGNDTRANLLMLLMERSGAASYPELTWDITYARNFYSWKHLRGALSAEEVKTDIDNSYLGSRCVSFPSGTNEFRAAVTANRRISDKDRRTLYEMRDLVEEICKGRSWRGSRKDLPQILDCLKKILDGARLGSKPNNQEEICKELGPQKDLQQIADSREKRLRDFRLGSKAANQYATYLRGAASFYGTEFDDARTAFQSLTKSKDKWLKETSQYMLPRVELNAAQEGAFNRWGEYQGPESGDRDALAAAASGFMRYQSKYPEGRYASSARGLMRRVYWLQQDLDRLAGEYLRLLNEDGGMATADIVEEMDIKLLFEKGAAGQITNPEMLAVIDLMRMREFLWGDNKLITMAELKSQAEHFAGRYDLYDFVLANYAFYVDGNARQVLELIPDAARQPNFTYLEFSRQALRGKALKRLKDPNEGGFWRDMIAGSKSLYQRPVVELGLATFYERRGQLEKVFAADSPIQDTAIRKILLQRVAGPKILRAVSRDSARPKDERDLALFILLYKNLSRGNYSDFLKDQAAIGPSPDGEAALWQLAFQKKIPLGHYADGAIAGAYSCPSFKKVVQTLADSPKNASARLCLGDFWLRKGYDYFKLEVTPNYAKRGGETPFPDLGDGPSEFLGKATYRHDIYTDIIADPRAKAGEKAYALYRAVYCYARTGYNSCGSKSVPQSQRKAWFRRLKRQYPNSIWAKRLKYYW